MNALIMESALMDSAFATKASAEPIVHKPLARMTALLTVHVIKQLTNAIVSQATQATTARIKNASKTATATEYANSAYATAHRNSQDQAANISSAPKTAAATETA